MKNIFITNFFRYQKEKQSHVISLSLWLVAVDTLVLLHAAPPQHLNVFGSQPAVSGQRGLSQAQRQQPADTVTVSQILLSTQTGHILVCWPSQSMRHTANQNVYIFILVAVTHTVVIILLMSYLAFLLLS